MKKENKIKIGVIDSGIDAEFLRNNSVNISMSASFHLDMKNKTLGFTEYDSEDLEKWKQDSVELGISDSSGHGTGVLSIIHKRLRDLLEFDFEFSIAKILDETNNCKSICLVEALDWMLNSVKPDYINMSLGAAYDNNKDKLYQLTKFAREKGIKIFCSATGLKSYPAEFDTVITIGDLGLLKFRPEITKIDEIISDPFVDIYKSGRWVKSSMFTSYACPLALSNYIRSNISLHKSYCTKV